MKSADKRAIEYFEKEKFDLAMRFFFPRAMRGDANAQYYVGMIYEFSLYDHRFLSYEKSLLWHAHSAQRGDWRSKLEQALQYYPQGWGKLRYPYAFWRAVLSRRWIRDAFPSLRMSAKRGNADSQSRLARLYSQGMGVTKNPRLARYWLLKSIKSNPRKYLFNVGLDFWDGFSVEQDIALGNTLVHQAAREGDSSAQYSLGVYYATGEYGLEVDCNESAKWYRLAGDQGETEAMYNLAMMYWYGEGKLPKDTCEGKRWFELALGAGNHSAIYAMRNNHEYGCFEYPINLEMAKDWEQKYESLFPAPTPIRRNFYRLPLKRKMIN